MTNILYFIQNLCYYNTNNGVVMAKKAASKARKPEAVKVKKLERCARHS